MYKNLIFLVVLFLTVAVCSCSRGYRNDVEESDRVVHLSLDDVEVFADLIGNQQDYDSLFQHPFMAFLQELHREYGMRITLYTYEHLRNGDGTDTLLEDMPLKYKNDFRKASDWLRIGYHSSRAEFDSLVTVADFRDSYNNLNRAIAQFSDSSMIASTLRFHYFFAPDSLLNALTGVKTLLCADDCNRLSYDLTASEAMTVAKRGRISKNEISYRRTDLRVDDNFRVLSDLKRIENVDTLVVFTHEWKLWHSPENYNHRRLAGKIKLRTWESINKGLFKETVKWLKEAGYKFSFLE
ncbi:MAG: hypothetical protein HDS97_00080 [Bacteroidales bacterium]|nr:hypothetical protein [Bacteroidales bacterium]